MGLKPIFINRLNRFRANIEVILVNQEVEEPTDLNLLTCLSGAFNKIPILLRAQIKAVFNSRYVRLVHQLPSNNYMGTHSGYVGWSLPSSHAVFNAVSGAMLSHAVLCCVMMLPVAGGNDYPGIYLWSVRWTAPRLKLCYPSIE